MTRGVAAVVALLVCTGCATAQKPTLLNRLVRQGTPAIDAGGPPAAGVRQSRAALPPLSISSASRLTGGSALESTDPALRTALGKVLLAPSSQHYLEVASAYRRLGVLDGAYDYLMQSLKVNGPDPAVYDALARLWRDWGYPAMGLADAHRAVYYAPQSAAARNTLGTVLHRLGRIRDAEAEFKGAIALDPQAWYAMANLCQVSLAQGRTKDAISQCHQAQTLGQRHARQKRP